VPLGATTRHPLTRKADQAGWGGGADLGAGVCGEVASRSRTPSWTRGAGDSQPPPAPRP